MDAAVSHLQQQWKELRDICSPYTSKQDARVKLNSLMALLQRFDNLGARKLYEERLLLELSAIGELHKTDSDHMQTVADILKVLLVFIWHKLLATDASACLTTHMQRNTKCFAINIHHTFAHFFIVQPRSDSLAVRWNKVCRDWLIHFASDARTFTQTEWNTFWQPDLDESTRFTISTTSFQLASFGKMGSVKVFAFANPVVHNLLSWPQVPIQMRMLLKLAITPLAYLNEMDRSQQLPYELLDELSSDTIRSLRLLMLQPTLFDPAKPLFHRLFTLDSCFSSLSSHRKFLVEWDKLKTQQQDDEDDNDD